MGKLTVRRRVEGSPEAVFDAMADLRNADRRISGIVNLEVLTDGDIGVGTRFRETRVMFKRECTEEMEITAFEPGRSYTVECESCGCHYATDIRVTPDGAGTMVEMEMRTRPLTFGARIMSPLGILMMSGVRKCLENDLEDIARAVESPEAAPAEA